NNVVSCASQTVALPTGRFTSLSLLATGVNGSQTAQPFTVNYSNSTSTAFTQSFSDWQTFADYAGEFKALCLPYSDTSGGSYNNAAVYLYGYTFALDSTNVVQSLTLPDN